MNYHGDKRLHGSVCLLGCVMLSVCAYSAVAQQTTAFNYQGRLSDGGSPASGTYDLQFALWDSSAAGTQIGTTQTLSAVAVAAGIFTVQLDFGVRAFPGADRFLEIGVRPAGGGSFTVLSPRQQISSTPYAIHTLSASTADTATNSTQLGGVAASQYVQTGDSRLSDARVPTPGSPNYIQSNPATSQLGANFNISGNGTAGGTISSNLVNATTQYNIGGNRILSAPGTNNIFAGPSAGQANTSGSGNAFVGAGAGQANTVGINNSFFGLNAGLSNIGFISAFTGQVTVGRNNSFFGVNAGKSIQQGTDNSFFGNNAGGSSTLGDQNSFFGSNAGSASKGDANSFFGLGAGSGNNGTRNSFFGVGAGVVGAAGAASGDDNSFFGTFAGENNTASQNSFFGGGAGMNNTAGTSNAFFGYQAGLNTKLGSRNTFIGAGAGNPSSDPDFEVSDSTAIGAFANTKGPIGQNVAVGSGASAFFDSTAVGKDASASGLQSIAIGIGAQATGLQSISIGANVTTPSTIGIGPDNGTFKTVIPGVMSVGSSVGTVGTAVLNLHNGGLVFDSSGALTINGDVGRMAFNLTGLGVHTLNPVRDFDVAGRARVEFIPPEASCPNCSVCFNPQGDLLQCGGSSLRWKTNVQPFPGGLDIIRRLQPISFTWKEFGTQDIGLGAEDVAKVAPSLTLINSEGEISGVKYDRLNILLINAVKEQQTKIEQLQREIRSLRTELHNGRRARNSMRKKP